jgi:two-component system, OmpR family, alkaline phosphatase synthesis response regulator PhoP
MERILVVEDDPRAQKALRRTFESEGYTIEVAKSGEQALEMFREAPPNLVLLDLRLPGLSGRDVCREIRKSAPALPLIVLSAVADEVDKVLLLELGADDYVTKPFSPKELLARVRTVSRRSGRPAVADQYVFDDVRVDFAKMELRRSGEKVALSAHEFKILKFFAQNPERVISRDQLLNEVWGYQCYPSTRTVDNHILKLRQKLEKEPARPVHFLTIHSAGYKFVP